MQETIPIADVCEAIRAEGIPATCNDSELERILDLARFDYVTAERADSSIAVLSFDGGAEWVVCEYKNRRDLGFDFCHARHECDLATDTPADLFVRVFLRE